MIIDALTALPSTPTTGDELPIERGTTTYKIDYDALETAIINNIPKIKTTTVSGTTNGSGNLLYNTFTGTRIIGAESNNSIVFPFLSGDYYYFKVLSWDDMSQKANASVTITVIYY